MRKTVSIFLDKELQRVMSPEAKTFLLQTWYRKMFPYIPFVTGLLASTSDINEHLRLSDNEAMQNGMESIGQNIHFKVPYADVQYGGLNFNFTKDLHPLAQARWGEVAAELHGTEIANELKEFLKRSENK